ncbi:hypothetical protein KDL29_02660 [bacterium]|nr:hypothetical protein [bacterium]
MGNSPGIGDSAIAVTGGQSLFDGNQEVSVVNYPYGNAMDLYEAHPLLLEQNHMDGRRMDYTQSKTVISRSRHHFYCAIDDEGRANRITLDDDTYNIAVLPLESSDIRRTVSATYAHGSAGLGLVSDNNGEDVYLEWDILGEFERLETPDFGWSNMHEIVVGPDGRWHIFYHDQATDSIMMWSTV